jgi:hypothetical protein
MYCWFSLYISGFLFYSQLSFPLSTCLGSFRNFAFGIYHIDALFKELYSAKPDNIVAPCTFAPITWCAIHWCATRERSLQRIINCIFISIICSNKTYRFRKGICIWLSKRASVLGYSIIRTCCAGRTEVWRVVLQRFFLQKSFFLNCNALMIIDFNIDIFSIYRVLPHI